MKEIWKPIAGYEGIYEVSSFGRIRSVVNGLLLTSDEARGYLRVTLFRNGVRNRQPVHRLVAQAFIPNPCDKPSINHKDEDKSNNRVDNLEWCTPKENCNHGNRNKKISRRISKPVKQLSKTGDLLAVWNSMTIASEVLGISLSEISVCTREHHKSAGGYKWRYANERH